MFIEPIVPIAPMQRIDGVSPLSKINGGNETKGISPFKDIFSSLIQDVVDTDKAVAADVQALATGQTDDLHTLGIDQTKAQLSIELMVQLRNRLMDSYNEIMRINL